MSKIKIILLLNILNVYFFSLVTSDCVINYPENIESLPRYEKHIGKYKLQIPYNGNKMVVRDGETISGFCDTTFRTFHCNVEKTEIVYDHWNGSSKRKTNIIQKKIDDKMSITLTCKSNKLHYEDQLLDGTAFECKKLNWSIYTTNEPYSWCEKNQNSSTFLLATKSTADHNTLAGICFNMEQLSLQTIVYNVTHFQRKDLEKIMGIGKSNFKPHQTLIDDLLGLKTTKISDLSKELLQQQLTTIAKRNSWLQLANYEVASIVQGDSYASYFEEYNNLLNIIWWHNLRVGNWKRFMNTLESYAYNNSFESYTGTSDVVRFPANLNCEPNNILEIKIGFKNETVPGYIWTYLKSNDNLNRDFIIVGYNSPYAEFFSLKNIIFCPDICSEIPWLSEINSSFRYAFAGIMFCCSTDFIKQTNYLQGFPMDVLMARQEENTTEIEVTTELEVTTEIDDIVSEDTIIDYSDDIVHNLFSDKYVDSK